MTGLNLESFLHLLRADVGAWAALVLAAAVLGLMAWTSWGSRRALRKCLVLSVVAHFGLALYGGTVPVALFAARPDAAEADAAANHLRRIEVVSAPEPDGGGEAPSAAEGGSEGTRGAGSVARWDRPVGGLALADAKLAAPRPEAAAAVAVRPGGRADLKAGSAAPDAAPPELSAPESRPDPSDPTPPPPSVSAAGDDDVAAPAVAPRRDPDRSAVAALSDARLRPGPDRVAAGRAGTGLRRPASLGDPAGPGAPVPDPTPAPPAVPRRDPARSGSESESEPAAPAAADPGPKDVAPVAVVAVEPEAPRGLAAGADVRARARTLPAAGSVSRDASPVARAPLAAPPAPVLALEGPVSGAADGLAERPAAGGTGFEPPAAADRPSEGESAGAEVVKNVVEPLPDVRAPEADVRRLTRPGPAAAPRDAAGARRGRPSASDPPPALARVTPSGVPALPEIRGAAGGRPLADVPEVYRSRLDPNRSARAFRAGASPASEQAVERALDWLARHQDTDGRWDGATAKYDDGTAVKGDDDFTVHCPPGEACFGECVYWEADTALTGLALLAYLGAGYTQTDGKYAETVGKGLDFLLATQKPDGDLRGKSRAVGMYCHAMATIAVCEAYALTGDERLRDPVGRAVAYLVRSRARDGLAWRYAPGAPVGDTSILGWVVMALKSAREVGIAVPDSVQGGTLAWLEKVSSGGENGLARYQPWDNVTPTMTAEAWACRQFLGVGGPGAASTEAAAYLLEHGPRSDTYNLYYWYYGTLAMYQHGGDAWYRWNAQVRDEITRRQRGSGHTGGSWDPDDSPYGAKGGRVYCTALATLSLEVYYRYLRLYDDPKIPPAVAPRGGDRDPALGRLSPGAPAGPTPPKR